MQKISSILVLCFFFLSGCSEHLVRVAAYEKGSFADQKMSLAPLEQRLEHEGHIFLIRESSAGGDSSFQGGCGCR